MLNPGSSMAALLDAPLRPGSVVWLGLRPARRAPMIAVEAVDLEESEGLVGDRYRHSGGARQVTLVARESLAAIASHLGRDAVRPEILRRNVVVAGLNLLALKGRSFQLGGAILDWSGECHPCSRMEEALGVGGYNAMRGFGGVTARVLTGGAVRIGDAVARL